jgi:hypothetical protein
MITTFIKSAINTHQVNFMLDTEELICIFEKIKMQLISAAF